MSTRSVRYLWCAVLAASVLLGGCATNEVERDGPGIAPATPVPDPVPRSEPRSRYGNPDSYEVFGKRYYTLKSSEGFQERGVASWYGTKFHGRRTSSGEPYDMYQMTAAHKELPLPTYVEVRNLANGRRAVVKVNDRGPFHDNRIIDLSYAAALKLGIAEKGTEFVEVVALGSDHPVQTVRMASNEPPPEPAPLFLQIGAFSERPNAERLRARVSDRLGEEVGVYEAATGPQRLYRVQIGPLATVEAADRIVATLLDLGISEHHFVGY